MGSDSVIQVDTRIFSVVMWVVVFLLGSAALVYAIILMHNLNRGILVLRRLLEQNEEKIKGTVTDISDISREVSQVAETVREDIIKPLKLVSELLDFFRRLLAKKADRSCEEK